MTSKKRIVVVEDDEVYAHVYQLKLEKQGYEVTVVMDSSRSVNDIIQIRPHLVVLDIMMPGVDGYALLQALKKDKATRAIPVVIFSNLGQEEDQHRAKALGADAYCVKSNMSVSDMIAVMQTHVA